MKIHTKISLLIILIISIFFTTMPYNLISAENYVEDTVVFKHNIIDNSPTEKGFLIKIESIIGPEPLTKELYSKESGDIELTKIRFSEEGEYWYKIYQEDEENQGYVYDDSAFLIYYNVFKDNENKLVFNKQIYNYPTYEITSSGNTINVDISDLIKSNFIYIEQNCGTTPVEPIEEIKDVFVYTVTSKTCSSSQTYNSMSLYSNDYTIYFSSYDDANTEFKQRFNTTDNLNRTNTPLKTAVVNNIQYNLYQLKYERITETDCDATKTIDITYNYKLSNLYQTCNNPEYNQQHYLGSWGTRLSEIFGIGNGDDYYLEDIINMGTAFLKKDIKNNSATQTISYKYKQNENPYNKVSYNLSDINSPEQLAFLPIPEGDQIEYKGTYLVIDVWGAAEYIIADFGAIVWRIIPRGYGWDANSAFRDIESFIEDKRNDITEILREKYYNYSMDTALGWYGGYWRVFEEPNGAYYVSSKAIGFKNKYIREGNIRSTYDFSMGINKINGKKYNLYDEISASDVDFSYDNMRMYELSDVNKNTTTVTHNVMHTFSNAKCQVCASDIITVRFYDCNGNFLGSKTGGREETVTMSGISYTIKSSDFDVNGCGGRTIEVSTANSTGCPANYTDNLNDNVSFTKTITATDGTLDTLLDSGLDIKFSVVREANSIKNKTSGTISEKTIHLDKNSNNYQLSDDHKTLTFNYSFGNVLKNENVNDVVYYNGGSLYYRIKEEVSKKGLSTDSSKTLWSYKMNGISYSKVGASKDFSNKTFNNRFSEKATKSFLEFKDCDGTSEVITNPKIGDAFDTAWGQHYILDREIALGTTYTIKNNKCSAQYTDCNKKKQEIKLNLTKASVEFNNRYLIGRADVQFIDVTQNNMLLEQRGTFTAAHGVDITNIYTTSENDISFWIDRGYAVVSNELINNPKFVASETKTILIKLKHTYTTVDKNTYEAGKCLNTACVTVQPEKGC